MKKFLLALSLLMLAACEDKPDPQMGDKLKGKWLAADNAEKWLAFTDNGRFTYTYGPGGAALEAFWRASGQAKFMITTDPDGSGPECHFKFDGDKLTVHDGKMNSCMGGDPINMAIEFKRDGT